MHPWVAWRRLVNESVPDGTTLHWHGVDLPNAEDGVAGVTQDAVPVGGQHVYRFVAEHPGTYWYHSHQVSHEQVRGGLFGVLVVEPAEPIGTDHDMAAAVHTYGRVATVNGVPGQQHHVADPGDTVRVRVVNTDNTVHQAWVTGAAYRVVAVDACDVNEPGPVDGATIQLPDEIAFVADNPGISMDHCHDLVQSASGDPRHRHGCDVGRSVLC